MNALRYPRDAVRPAEYPISAATVATLADCERVLAAAAARTDGRRLADYEVEAAQAAARRIRAELDATLAEPRIWLAPL